VRPSERYIEEKQTFWTLKVSNTADNTGITQSQARDTRYQYQYQSWIYIVHKRKASNALVR